MTGFADILSSAGVAAVVSAVLMYLFKPLLESRIQRAVAAKIEALRAEYSKEHEYLKELIKQNADLYPQLIESVYRSRNIVRELEKVAPSYDSALRSKLGTHALALTEGLYRARIFLAPELFEPLHEFKGVLQQFVFDYDLVTGPSPSAGVLGALRDARIRLDDLYEQTVLSAQQILHTSVVMKDVHGKSLLDGHIERTRTKQQSE